MSGGRKEENSGHLESRVFIETAVHEREHRYIASLQLNGSHICSSGLFQMYFLLTTKECASHLGESVKRGDQRATAVFVNPILNYEQRINIYKIAYCLRHKNLENDVGVIMLVNNPELTSMNILHLRPIEVNLRRHGSEASVCGWAIDDPLNNFKSASVKFSGNLYCMVIKLHGEKLCYKNIPLGNYKSELLCGTLDGPREISIVDDVGSPVTKTVYNDDGHGNVIVGVTIQPYEHGNVTFHRLIRIGLVLNDIQAMVKQLEAEGAADGARISEFRDLMDELNERPKYQ